MDRKIVFSITVSAILLFVLFEDYSMLHVRATRAWIVDKNDKGDFCNIQEAINAANPGDIIEVSVGKFFEHIVVNKSLTLIGEDRNKSIIDGNGTGTVVTVNTDYVNISGFTIQQSGDHQRGVFLDGSNNSTIWGNIIVDNYYGVWLNNSEKNLIKDNLVHGNIWGIYLQDSKNNIIESNMIVDNYRRGLHLDFSDNNTVNENSVTNHVEAIYLESSSNNSLRNNNLTENMYGFGVLGSELVHFIQDIDTSNRIDGKPMYYWVNQHDKRLPTNASYVAVVNSTGITVKDLNLTHYQEGLLFAYTTNSTIENVRISNARCGTRLVSCEGLKVIENAFTRNAKGIRLDYSSNNTINGNTILDNHEGIFLDHSSNNIIAANTVADNIRGIFVYYSTHNTVYHNNFINNEKQVFICLAKISVINTWDWSGEGNYWSDYISTDEEDGIGDAPYILDRNNQDNHALLGLFSDFSVILDETQECVTAICNSTISGFIFSFSSKVIIFNVTGPDGTLGFCRVTIPHRLLSGSYEVLVDGLPPLALKELASSNSTHTVLYFTYVHSTRQVIIVPEYSVVLLLLFAVATLTITVARRLSTERKIIREQKDFLYRTELLKR